MNTVFAPGCALLIYKPELAEKIFNLLRKHFGVTGMYKTCCHHEPKFEEETRIISLCPGCIRRYGSLYDGVSAVSLFEMFLNIPGFQFPDHSGLRMTVLDACPTRKDEKLHTSVRTVLSHMNIEITEPEATGVNGKCCGDSYYGSLPKERVLEKMTRRASEMPEEDVAVYCVSCVKSMKNGGKTPRYIPDLIFNEETSPGESDPDVWHSQINGFIDSHR